jgi:flavodoxin
LLGGAAMNADAKILVVYYSRTGTTKKVAEAIAAELKCDIEEIVDARNRQGLVGWLSGGQDATLRRLTDIQPPQKSPANYDLVVIGTPIWAWTMAPAIRTYLAQNKLSLKKAAFFCTMGGSGDKGTFKAIAEILGKQSAAELTLLMKDVTAGNFAAKVAEFAQQIRKS